MHRTLVVARCFSVGNLMEVFERLLTKAPKLLRIIIRRLL